MLVLVQPPAGSTIPTDRPVVVFRLAPTEPADPIDVSSFRVWLDGSDRSSGFRVDGAEAWGSLAEPATGSSAPAGASVGAGVHLVTARLCTVRGICATTNALVTVLPPTPVAALPAGSSSGSSPTGVSRSSATTVSASSSAQAGDSTVRGGPGAVEDRSTRHRTFLQMLLGALRHLVPRRRGAA